MKRLTVIYDHLENLQVPMHDQRSKTPPSKAVQAAKKYLTPKAQPRRFEPETHISDIENMETARNNNEDSLIGTKGTRTPARITQTKTPEDYESVSQSNRLDLKIKDDMILEQILPASCTKPTTRIEDSVEAIDALEDAIEKVGEALPMIETMPPSAIKERKPKSVAAAVIAKAVDTKKNRTAGKISKATVPKRTSGTQVKSSVRASVMSHVSQAKRSTPRVNARASSIQTPAPKTTLPSDVAIPSTASKSQAPASKRSVSALSKAPFQPAKSSKPPTRPSFELPGEAISRKLKEQREERLKREEEETNKKREFKARPVRLSPAPVVKATAASKARMSMIKELPGSGENEHVPKARLSIRNVSNSSMAAVAVDGTSIDNKRLSTLNVTKRMSTAAAKPAFTVEPINITSTSPKTAAPKANTSAPRIRGPSLVIPARTSSTQKGKEVFGRSKAEVEEKERLRREKEELARKARAGAAERGRIASREWAEKMKARKASGVGEKVKVEAN